MVHAPRGAVTASNNRRSSRAVAYCEGEARWNTTPRWALIGFAGAGRAWGREPFGDTQVSKDAGFRYLLARRLGLYVGIDYAFGPDGEACYIQVGNAWR
jgi:hypothetical protein